MILPPASKIYSTLGNSNSLVPLAIKDVANSIGLTTASYITGDEVEGRDRFIDEFGTQAIWLFGIPGFKKILDLTLFKSLKYDPEIDVRVLKDPKILEKAKQYAPTETIQSALQKAGKNAKTFKGLSFGKFVASTLLTILSYWGLTKFRHSHTEQHIKDLYLKKHGKKQEKAKEQDTAFPLKSVPQAFGAIHSLSSQKSKQTSFTGGFEDFMFSPAKNLMIVDGAISGERIFESRNPQDQIGYIVKEGGFWMFMYLLGPKIQNHFEKSALKKHNKPIDLDARVIESTELKQALKNKTLLEGVKKFPAIGKDFEIYDFICNPQNKDNIVVKMSKMSDIINVIDSKNLDSAPDTRKYIDIEEVKGVRTKLENLYTKFNEYKTSFKSKNPEIKLNEEEILERFLKEVKSLKRKSILKNIGSCIAALGIAVPAIMVGLRYLDKDNKNFKVKEEIEQKLAKELNTNA